MCGLPERRLLEVGVSGVGDVVATDRTPVRTDPFFQSLIVDLDGEAGLFDGVLYWGVQR